MTVLFNAHLKHETTNTCKAMSYPYIRRVPTTGIVSIVPHAA